MLSVHFLYQCNSYCRNSNVVLQTLPPFVTPIHCLLFSFTDQICCLRTYTHSRPQNIPNVIKTFNRMMRKGLKSMPVDSSGHNNTLIKYLCCNSFVLQFKAKRTLADPFWPNPQLWIVMKSNRNKKRNYKTFSYLLIAGINILPCV